MNAMKGFERAALLILLALVSGLLVAGDAFLTTERGARYKDLKPGAGEYVEMDDVVTIHFVGWLDDKGNKGREIYNSRRDGNPVSFVVGTERVMPGWTDGVLGMRPGGKRLLMLPPELGYGARSVEDVIPPNAPLIFVIELVDLERPPPR